VEAVFDFLSESNHIEGMYHEPNAYFFAYEREDRIGDPLVRDSVSAWTYLEKNCKRSITPYDVLELHSLQMFNSKLSVKEIGQFRKTMVFIGRHVPPGAGSLHFHIDNLCQNMKEKNVKKAMDFHCEFESIHPFTDGNGRVGRLVWAWYRFYCGAKVYPILNEFDGESFLEKRENYYQMLRNYHKKRDEK